jgi:hypothetical protein
LIFNTAQKKESIGVASGGLEGHAFGLPWPVHCPGRFSFRNLVISLWQWGDAPFCWRIKFSVKSSLC